VISAPAKVWLTTGTDALVKFQCRGIVGDDYTLSYLQQGWDSDGLKSYLDAEKVVLTAGKDGDIRCVQNGWFVVK